MIERRIPKKGELSGNWYCTRYFVDESGHLCRRMENSFEPEEHLDVAAAENEWPTNDEERAAWLAYHRAVLKTGEDPLGEYTGIPSHRVQLCEFRGTFQYASDLQGDGVLAELRRDGELVPLSAHDAPSTLYRVWQLYHLYEAYSFYSVHTNMSYPVLAAVPGARVSYARIVVSQPVSLRLPVPERERKRALRREARLAVQLLTL